MGSPEKIAFLVSCLAVALTLRYCQLVLNGKIQPVLATWLMFCISVSLSFSTYVFTEKHSITGNLGNVVDLFEVWAIFVTVIFYRRKNQRIFNRLEIKCILASAAIVIFWIFTGQHAVSNLLLQIILVIAYAPLVQTLWLGPRNTEPLDVWTATLMVCAGAMYLAVCRQDYLGMVYSGRAIILVSIVLFLILRLKFRSHKNIPA